LEPIIEKKTVFRFNNILFDYGKADLKDSSKVILDRLAEVLINNPKVKVELSAHTDSRGSDKANYTLSDKRAASCVLYLIEKGVPRENIVSRGYGETKPLNGCVNNVKCSEEEYAVNRRVEIKVLDMKE
jgi:outer membrane protein OmpA-like peptidoglycan-associated protein